MSSESNESNVCHCVSLICQFGRCQNSPVRSSNWDHAGAFIVTPMAVESHWDLSMAWLFFHGCSWFFMVVHGFSWLFMVFHGCSWFSWLFIVLQGFHVFSLFFMVFHGFFHGFSWFFQMSPVKTCPYCPFGLSWSDSNADRLTISPTKYDQIDWLIRLARTFAGGKTGQVSLGQQSDHHPVAFETSEIQIIHVQLNRPSTGNSQELHPMISLAAPVEVSRTIFALLGPMAPMDHA